MKQSIPIQLYFSLICFMSVLIFKSNIFALCCVVRRFLCPSILDTVSIGTPLLKVTVVANV